MPARSRLTARQAPLGRAARLGDALRASREALGDVQRQLDTLLAALRSPAGEVESEDVDRLHRATRRAGAAVDRLVGA